MQTHRPDQEKPVQQFIKVSRGRYRRVAFISAVCLLLGLLPVLTWLLMVWGGALYVHLAAARHQRSAIHIQVQSRQNVLTAARLIQTASRVDSFLSSQVNTQQFSGSVLVAQHGQIVLARGYGMANWQNSTPATVNTRFYLGSITKEFTALATLILQAQGKLHVSDRICTYIANCPPPWQPVTIHNLLTHTSGIPELDDAQISSTSPQDWINSFDTSSLQFEPGSQFDYCSTCYQILAYVVQQAAGVPYSQFVQQMILNPLHMNRSGFDTTSYYARPDSAIGYESWQVNAPTVEEHADPHWSFLFGSGLLYSTVEDLYRWDQALYHNTLVSQQTLARAFTPYVAATFFPGSRYGYGWYLAPSPVQGHRLIWHDGMLDGFRNYIGRYVDDDVTIIFLSNLSTVDVVGLEHSLEKIVFSH